METTEYRPHRVLVALDPSAPATAVMPFAFALAARFHAEIDAFLLSAGELARAAELPFATEISLLPGIELALNAPLVDRRLRNLSQRIRGMMAELAATGNVPWTLRLEERATWEQRITQPEQGCLLVLGHYSHHLDPSRPPPRSGLCVLHDSTAAGRTALALAMALDPLAVAIPIEHGSVATARIAARLSTLRPGTVLLSDQTFAALASILRPLVQRLGCTLILLGQPLPNTGGGSQ